MKRNCLALKIETLKEVIEESKEEDSGYEEEIKVKNSYDEEELKVEDIEIKLSPLSNHLINLNEF